MLGRHLLIDSRDAKVPGCIFKCMCIEVIAWLTCHEYPTANEENM